mmetsp:Transcript_23522/g.37456  ORF Transcript_23522/g.37456 Transcript_23522/m.37456 type:complete len:85 (+) Transcript_23522:309-563(+)
MHSQHNMGVLWGQLLNSRTNCRSRPLALSAPILPAQQDETAAVIFFSCVGLCHKCGLHSRMNSSTDGSGTQVHGLLSRRFLGDR